MCGIIGITGIDNVVEELYAGLISLQHRGQDACGIMTFDEVKHKYRPRRGHGLVRDVVEKKHLQRLRGRSGIAHVRYATVGDGSEDDIQPFYESSRFLASMAHNGNLTNFSGLKSRYRNIGSGCDVEAILKVFHTNVETKFDKTETWNHLKSMFITDVPLRYASEDMDFELPPTIDVSSDAAIDMIFSSIRKVMETCDGSYSVITHIPGLGMLAFRDPYGIKPLVIGKKKTDIGFAYAFASEDVAFQMPLDYQFLKDLDAGSAFLVKEDGTVIERSIMNSRKAHPCIFEWIYFASPCSTIGGVSVSEYRYQLGKEHGLSWKKNDLPTGKGVVVAAVPSASKRGAAGFSDSAGIPLREVFVRNNYMHRGFILPDKDSREYNAALKLPIDLSALKGVESLVIVDDSIVRGDTSPGLIKRLRREMVKKDLPLKNIYFLSLAPPNLYPCVYGIDMSVDNELIAARLGSTDAVRRHIGSDYLIYQEVPVLGKVLDKLSGCGGSTYCDACFSGKYPTGISPGDIERIKQDRIADKGSDYCSSR